MANEPEPAAIEQICLDFESSWNADIGLAWEEFIVRADSSIQSHLLCNLIALDMEFRLRRKHEESPRCELYFHRFATKLSRQHMLSLAIKEFRFRQVWGDQPEIASFEQRFPDFGAGLAGECREFLLQLSPITLSVFGNGKLKFELLLTEPLVLGRQRKDEPQPIRVVERNRDTKLILVGNELSDISRSHIRVEPVARGKISIRNDTSDGKVEIELAGTIPPRSTRTFQVPVVVDVGAPVVVRFAGGLPSHSPLPDQG